MIYFPITLSVVLGSSLIVAVFFNSMLVSQFMEVNERDISTKSLWRLTAILGSLGLILIFNAGTLKAIGTIMLVTPSIFWSYKFAIKKWAQKFQNIILVSIENKYRKFLAYALKGFRPVLFLVGTFFLLFTSFALMGIFPPQVEFFPNNDPAQIIIYVESVSYTHLTLPTILLV